MPNFTMIPITQIQAPARELAPLIKYAGNDTFYGDNVDNTYNGYAGDDWLFGNGGNDTLIGGTGDDHLLGGAGQDVLIGGRGQDRLQGGEGADRFVFTIPGEGGLTSSTVDSIYDLQFWDRIDVPDAVLNGPRIVVAGTEVTSIEQAVGLSNFFDSYNDSNATAILWANPTTNNSFLVMDMDANGQYDTGVVLVGFGTPAESMLEWSLI